MKNVLLRYALGGFLVASLGAWDCGGGSSSGNPDAKTGGTPDGPVGVTGPYTHFVTSGVTVGTTTKTPLMLGFDLDGDGKIDNALGKSLYTFDSQLHINDAITAALKKGDFVILHSLHGDTSNATAATWQTYLGDPNAPADPNTFVGGTYKIAAADSGQAILSGTVTSGDFVTSTPGNVTIKVSLAADSAPITLALKSARIEAKVTGTGTSATCTGRIGGGILATDLTNNLLPQVVGILNMRLSTDTAECGAGMSCQSTKDTNCCSSENQTLLTVFDSDGNFMISNDEATAVLGAVFVPDVDLLDASGNPGKDTVKESVSVAIGFDCVATTFTAPNEH
jgi:hypothetical protein